MCEWGKWNKCRPRFSAKTPRPGERKHITASKARAEIPKPVCLVPSACSSPFSCSYTWDCLVLLHILPQGLQVCINSVLNLVEDYQFHEHRPLQPGRGDTVSWLLFPHSPSIHYLPVPQTVPLSDPSLNILSEGFFFLWNTIYSDKASHLVVASLLRFDFSPHQCLDFQSKTWAHEYHKGEEIHLKYFFSKSTWSIWMLCSPPSGLPEHSTEERAHGPLNTFLTDCNAGIPLLVSMLY